MDPPDLHVAFPEVWEKLHAAWTAFDFDESKESAHVAVNIVREHGRAMGIPQEVLDLLGKSSPKDRVLDFDIVLARAIFRYVRTKPVTASWPLPARGQELLTGADRRMLHLVLDIEEEQFAHVDNLYELHSIENKLKSLAFRGLISVRVTERGKEMLDAHYDAKGIPR